MKFFFKTTMLSILMLASYPLYAQLKVDAQERTITFIDDDPTPILYQWMGTNSKTLTKKGMVYKKPKRFKEIGKTECFNDYPLLKETFTCMGNQLQSNDKQFITFIVNRPILDAEFQQSMEKLFRKKYNLVDKQHQDQLRNILIDYYGDSIAESWQDSLEYYPPDKAKKTWNADTIIRTSLHLHPRDYYEEVYKHVDIFLIQRQGRGYVYLVSFYTDKARRRLRSYQKRVEGMLRYEDHVTTF